MKTIGKIKQKKMMSPEEQIKLDRITQALDAIGAKDLAELRIDWQTKEHYQTKKGKLKTVLTGIPGVYTWGRWKRAKAQTKETLAKHGCLLQPFNGEFLVVLWENKRNKALSQAICESWDVADLTESENKFEKLEKSFDNDLTEQGKTDTYQAIQPENCPF